MGDGMPTQESSRGQGVPSPDRVGRWGAAVSALTLVLALIHLGRAGLWIDESVTGLLGAHILKFGLPRVFDAPLLITVLAGDFKDGLWIWDGWFQAYLSAAGEALFGRTALGARFFHAVAGALIPWAAYPLFRSASTRRGVAEAATLITGLSVPLLVSARQAHYYAEGTLLTIVVLRAYLAVLASRRYAAAALTTAAVLLFHTNFLWFAVLGTALSLHLAVLRPPGRVLARAISSGLAAMIIVAPYAIWAQIWSREFPTPGGQGGHKPVYLLLAMLRHSVLELSLYGAPLVLLLLAGVVWAGWRRPILATGCLLGAAAAPMVLAGPATSVQIWAFGGVLGLALLLGAGTLWRAARRPAQDRGRMLGVLLAFTCLVWLATITWFVPAPLLRYLIPLLPILAFFTAASAFEIFRRGWLAWPVVVLLIASNVASAWPLRYCAERESLRHLLVGDRDLGELNRIRLPIWTGLPTLSVAFGSTLWGPLFSDPNLQTRSLLGEYVAEIRRPMSDNVSVLSDYINSRKRPGDRFATQQDSPYPIVFHTGLVPVPASQDMEPPRFIFPSPYTGSLLAGWLPHHPYRQVTLSADRIAMRAWPEMDFHVFQAHEGKVPIVVWERIDPETMPASSSVPTAPKAR